MKKQLNDILVIARFSGRCPLDAIVLDCEACHCKGLCRPHNLPEGLANAKAKGRGLSILCDVCARKPIRDSMMVRGVELMVDQRDADGAIDYIEKLRRETTEEN